MNYSDLPVKTTPKWAVVIMQDHSPRKLRMTIGNQSFDLDVQDYSDEPERMEWFQDMLTKAMTRLTASPAEPSMESATIKLQVAAHAVLDLWDSHLWDWAKQDSSIILMHNLRCALDCKNE